MANDKVGWTRSIDARDPYALLMAFAADMENRADALDAAMETVESEIGPAGFANDDPIRAASWSDRLRSHARSLREQAVVLHGDAEVGDE